MLLGAYGWLHDHWDEEFYPDDLPRDWQLTYYSNEFSTVLVPANFWSQTLSSSREEVLSCEDWLDDVSEVFRFYIECRESVFADLSIQAFSENLQLLQAQLAGLVITDENISASSMKILADLAKQLETEIFIVDDNLSENQSNKQIKYFQHTTKQLSRFVLFENDLLELRQAKEQVEFMLRRFEKTGTDTSRELEEVTIIVNHPKLSADDLMKFRAVLEIMGL